MGSLQYFKLDEDKLKLLGTEQDIFNCIMICCLTSAFLSVYMSSVSVVVLHSSASVASAHA